MEAAGLAERRHAYDRAGPVEQGRPVAVARPLDQRREERPRRRGGIAPRAHDEGDVRVTEPAGRPLQGFRPRDVAGVGARDEVVGVSVFGEPGVDVPALRAGLVGPRPPVPLGHPEPREVVHAQLGAEHPGLGVVPLVEQPDVQRARIPHEHGGLQRGPHRGEGLHARDAGGQQGEPGARFRCHGDRVPGHRHGVGHGGHVGQQEQLEQADGDQRQGVGEHQPPPAAPAPGPVRRPQHVEQQQPGDGGEDGQQEDGGTRPRGTAVPHPVPRRERLRGAAVVIVTLRRHRASRGRTVAVSPQKGRRGGVSTRQDRAGEPVRPNGRNPRCPPGVPRARRGCGRGVSPRGAAPPSRPWRSDRR